MIFGINTRAIFPKYHLSFGACIVHPTKVNFTEFLKNLGSIKVRKLRLVRSRINRKMSNCVMMVSLALAIIINIEDAHSRKPPLGKAINMFHGYGHLAKNMRVMQRNVSDTWIYREPSVNVFEIPLEYLMFLKAQKISLFAANVQTAYCLNTEELVQEYFRHFDFEGVDQPALAFTANWSTAAIAQHFGLEESFVGNNNCYVLLKVASSKDHQSMFDPPDGFPIDEVVASASKSVIVNDPASADKFIEKFGTHYISSFSTGDFLYQVFVFKSSSCHRLKERKSLTRFKKLMEFKTNTYFSLRNSSHIGKIQAASGNPMVESWAAKNLRSSFKTFANGNYSSLENLRMNYKLRKQLNEVLQERALIQMELKTLTPVFGDFATRKWFEKHLEKRLEEMSVKLG